MQTLEIFAPPTTANQWSAAATTAAINLLFLPQKGGPVPLIDVLNDETAPGL